MTTIKNKNYYEILEIPKTASQEEIAEAYRHLSLKYHPKITTKENSAVYEYHFQKLAEAYEVLSDPDKKGIYDFYGQEGLHNGIIDKEGNLKGGYVFLGNGHEIFEKFMGTSNPFALIRDNEKIQDERTIFGNAFGGQNQPPMRKLPDMNVDLECTLEELYNGCIKTIKYTKKQINYDLRTTSDKEVSLDVEILKGYDKNTVIAFKEMGNDAPGITSSDLFIHIKEKAHPNFKRVNKDDLIYIHKITLAQALNSEPVRLTTLDNRKIAISMDEIISPQTIKFVPNEGMPIFQKEIDVKDFAQKKGNLYIKFDIQFPEYIDPVKKQEITKLLETVDEEEN